MANADASFGLRLVGHTMGSPFNARVRPYYIPSTYGTALYVGDSVTKTGTSNTVEYNGNPVGSLPEVNRTAVGTGNPLTGVVVGFQPNPDSLVTYHAASTAQIAWVCDDPNALFEIQTDGTLAATAVGLNAVLIYTNSGSTYSGYSGAELDSGTTTAPAGTAAFQLKILGFVRDVSNDVASANSRLLVRINNHTESHATAGI